MTPVLQMTFSNAFWLLKILYFESLFIWLYCLGYDCWIFMAQQWLGNCLHPNKRQAITGVNRGLVHWNTYVSYGLNVLSRAVVYLIDALNLNIILCIWHYSDVIMGAMASQITSLTIVHSTVYSGADQENIEALRHWPLCGEFTGDRWIPRANGQ